MYAIMVDKIIDEGKCSCGADKSCYPMLYYAPHDPFGPHLNPRYERRGRSSFPRMPSNRRDSDALYYTLDENGNYVILTPNGRVPVQSHQNLTPNGNVPVPSHQNLTPNGNVPVPSHQNLTPNGNVPVPSRQNLTPNGNVPVPSRQNLTPNGNVPVQSRQNNIGRNNGARRQALQPPAPPRSESISSSQPSDSSPTLKGSRNRSSSGRQSDGNGESRPYKTYKTLLCNMFETTGSCSYGIRCGYAHGKEEIRPYRPHPKYKTELCNKVNSPRGCRYRHKCYFRHPDDHEIQSRFVPRGPQRSTPSIESPGNVRDGKKKVNFDDTPVFARTFRRSPPPVAMNRSNSCSSLEAFTRQRCNAIKEALGTHLDAKKKRQNKKKDVYYRKRNV